MHLNDVQPSSGKLTAVDRPCCPILSAEGDVPCPTVSRADRSWNSARRCPAATARPRERARKPAPARRHEGGPGRLYRRHAWSPRARWAAAAAAAGPSRGTGLAHQLGRPEGPDLGPASRRWRTASDPQARGSPTSTATTRTCWSRSSIVLWSQASLERHFRARFSHAPRRHHQRAAPVSARCFYFHALGLARARRAPVDIARWPNDQARPRATTSATEGSPRLPGATVNTVVPSRTPPNQIRLRSFDVRLPPTRSRSASLRLHRVPVHAQGLATRRRSRCSGSSSPLR